VSFVTERKYEQADLALAMKGQNTLAMGTSKKKKSIAISPERA